MTHPSLPLYDAMSTQRAVRRLREDPIPDDVLKRLLQAGAWAPSGGNLQPWRVIVVRDDQRKQQLAQLYQAQWAVFAAQYQKGLARLTGEALAKQERILASGDYLSEHFASAPVVLVYCFNPKLMAITDSDLDRPSVVGGGSVYPAIQNTMLACVSEGIGCTLTTLLCLEEAAMKEILEIPKDWHTCAAVPIGYPQGKGHGPITRRAVEEQCFADRFGDPLVFQVTPP
ncbi:NADH dehydrogenase [Halioglobus japonicus]|nr:NADH dehydrogenase [Halioglobus japonicus]